MPTGRPSKYKPEFCDVIIELGREGKTKAHMAQALDICRDTLFRWVNEYPEFSDAMKRAEAGMHQHLHQIFVDQATGDGPAAKGNVTAAIFLAKNQLPDVYRDRHEHKVEAEIGVFEISYEGANYGDEQKGDE